MTQAASLAFRGRDLYPNRTLSFSAFYLLSLSAGCMSLGVPQTPGDPGRNKSLCQSLHMWESMPLKGAVVNKGP